jgi:hypothetical protein
MSLPPRFYVVPLSGTYVLLRDRGVISETCQCRPWKVGEADTDRLFAATFRRMKCFQSQFAVPYGISDRVFDKAKTASYLLVAEQLFS